jgi:hypothetical protein
MLVRPVVLVTLVDIPLSFNISPNETTIRMLICDIRVFSFKLLRLFLNSPMADTGDAILNCETFFH